MQDSLTRKRIIDDYFNAWPIRKLPIGCEDNLLHGWLNSDYHPYSDKILHLDATRPFIYDEKTPRFSMESIGFAEIVKCDLSASDDEALRGLENEGQLPPGFLKLESLILEATKR